jgi:hypothetical protein
MREIDKTYKVNGRLWKRFIKDWEEKTVRLVTLTSSKLTFGIGLQLGRDPFLLFVKVNDL